MGKLLFGTFLVAVPGILDLVLGRGRPGASSR